jgi:hypothetical protein
MRREIGKMRALLPLAHALAVDRSCELCGLLLPGPGHLLISPPGTQAKIMAKIRQP